MKESFSELYARLYKENVNQLETLRKKEKRSNITIILIIIAAFIFASFNHIFMIFSIMGIIIYIILANKGKTKVVNRDDFKVDKREKTYSEVFKEKIVGPIIEHAFKAARYDAKSGLPRHEYTKARYNERFDIYYSDDLIVAPLNINDENSTFITFAEVNTQTETKDSDGNRTYVTVFHGLAGSFLIPKELGKNVYIRANGKVSNWNKNKVKMDMSEFEKIFDVESDDPILTMRILTADVMAQMIDLYKKYKCGFEINIINDTVYMRLRTGAMFEPSIFKNSMEYKQVEKYYLMLKALTSISRHMYDTISKLDV